ncbi:thiosulfate oxidation carrier protein SoxY [Methylopila sp. M107]|uniref:thiosulfate oxidation carrier protein SoxY n=1 Tax=Methylopila sp. M107 TaxID=1101190 RepID=UPI000373F205|nr:thiosulfate oxidation carrier protein SoxY [Methylopila sp. M107]
MAATLTVEAAAAPVADEAAAAIAAFTGGREALAGGVTLSLPALVEDGDHAPLSVVVDGGPRVRRIGVFSSGNPVALVAVYRLGPGAVPRLTTNIRLWRSQTVTVVAELDDGGFRAAAVDVSVTLAACRSE